VWQADADGRVPREPGSLRRDGFTFTGWGRAATDDAGDYAFSSAGLGLSICKKLIAAMGGELGVETELEKGTRFHFVLDLPQGSRL